jgi:transposase-like protein
MGQVLRGSATTTAAVRRAIQNSQESLRALARRYGINQQAVAKWKRRTSVADIPIIAITTPANPVYHVSRDDFRCEARHETSADRRLPMRQHPL